MDIYAEITNRIIDQMESGIIPWEKPWVSLWASIPLHACQRGKRDTLHNSSGGLSEHY